jgi:hypothetical protein
MATGDPGGGVGRYPLVGRGSSRALTFYTRCFRWTRGFDQGSAGASPHQRKPFQWLGSLKWPLRLGQPIKTLASAKGNLRDVLGSDNLWSNACVSPTATVARGGVLLQ